LTKTRVRFAPSPTGTLHIGGARTALFNWLFARNTGGKFVLRIEDTDSARSTEGSAHGIIEGLKWLRLNWDEGPDKGGPYGPYRQSERFFIYQKYLQKLLNEDKAYYCFCTAHELQKAREKAKDRKEDYKYSGRCRTLTDKQIQKYLDQDLKPVIRLKVPAAGVTTVPDLIRDNVEFSNSLFDDFIIAKSDGWPTYNFAVVIDDYSMMITHVIRAEEHLSNTPKQLLIYDALGFPSPEFAHVSMILAPDRSKLSKRHGATSVQEYKDKGYLPEALINYLALLGWSSGEDIDFWTLDELIKRFRITDVSRSPAVYDTQKLTWMNGHYLSKADPEHIVELLEDRALASGWLMNNNRDYFKQVIDLVSNRVKTVNEIVNEADYFFNEIASYDEKGVKKYFSKDNSLVILHIVLSIIEECTTFNAEKIENLFRLNAEKMQLKAADLIHPTRLAISGRIKTPGLFEVMEILGKDKCIARVNNAIEYVNEIKNGFNS